MEKIKDEPAFPVDNVNIEGGLTKREIFAMAAMTGLLQKRDGKVVDRKKHQETIANAAVGYADALLAEMAKEKT
jgi:hypothetical protein